MKLPHCVVILCALCASSVFAQADRPAYDAGYKAGYDSAAVLGDERARMHRQCDAMIAEHHFDKKSFDDGFIAGTAKADKKLNAARTERWKKQSFEAGWAAEKEFHRYNGMPPIEVATRISKEAEKWDTASWTAGFKAAHEEDTRPYPTPAPGSTAVKLPKKDPTIKP